jgi:hypothetical protein
MRVGFATRVHFCMLVVVMKMMVMGAGKATPPAE